MIKKIISLLLMICIALSGIVFAYAENDESVVVTSYEVRLLKAIGIYDVDFPEFENLVTRSDLALYVSRLYGNKFVMMSHTGRFSDVDKDDKFMSAVEFLSSNGILSGTGNGIFMPGRPAEVTEAVKVLVDVLGYRYMANVNGGYPTGYMVAANQINLLNGLSDLSGYINGETFAKLLYNALEIDIAQSSGITITESGYGDNIDVYEGVNLLSENFDIYRLDGRVDATPMIALKGDRADEGKIVINGKTLFCNDSAYYDYLGYTLECLYRIDKETGKNYLIFAEPLDTKTMSFVGNDLIKLRGLLLDYYDENNGKSKTTAISPDANIIFNFEKVDLKTEYFEKPYSKIDLIDNDSDSKIDVILIEEYDSITAGNIGKSSYVVFDKDDITKSLSLKEELYDRILLVDEGGAEISFDSIAAGNTITYVIGGKIIKGYVSTNLAVGVIESECTTGNLHEYTIGGNVHVTSPLISVSGSMVGKPVTMHIDVFGNVACIIEGIADGLLPGFLIASGRAGGAFNTDYFFEIFTSDGDETVYKAADRVKLNGTNVKKENLPESLTQSIIVYSLNSDGYINVIEQPVAKDSSYEDGRLMISYPEKRSYAYLTNKTFDSQCVVGEQTKYFSIEKVDINNDGVGDVYDTSTLRCCNKNYFVDRTYYTVEGYSLTKESEAAVAILHIGASSDSISIGYNLMVVDEVRLISVDGEATYKVKGFERGNTLEFGVDDDYLDEFDSLNIEKGDVVRYSINIANQITNIEMIFDISEPISASNPIQMSAESFAANTRIHYSKVIAKTSDNMLYYLYCYPSSSSPFGADNYTGFLSDCLAFPASRYSKISVIEIYGSRVFVRSGTLSDIEQGDTFIDYSSLQAPYGFVLIKER